MTLQEQVREDVNNIFFNCGELANLQKINGRDIPVVEDGDRLMQYKQCGIYHGTKLFYAKAQDFSPIPRAGDVMMYGQTKWSVEECKELGGVLEIILTRYSR